MKTYYWVGLNKNSCWMGFDKNGVKTVGACKLCIENTYGRKQNKALSDILSPHIPYKNLEYEQTEKIQHDFLPV